MSTRAQCQHHDNQQPDVVWVKRVPGSHRTIRQLRPDRQGRRREDQTVVNLGTGQDLPNETVQPWLRRESNRDGRTQTGGEERVRHRESTEHRRRDQTDFGRQPPVVVVIAEIGHHGEPQHTDHRDCQKQDAAQMNSDRAKQRGETKGPNTRRSTGGTIPLGMLTLQPDQQTKAQRNGEIEPRRGDHVSALRA